MYFSKQLWCHCNLHKGRFVVVHLCSNLPIDPRIFPERQIFTKNYYFWGRKATFFKATAVKFSMRVRSWDSFTQAKYCKNRLSWYTPLGRIYYYFWQFFWAVSPHLLSKNGKIWCEGADLEDPPRAKFCKKNRLRGYTFFGQIYTKNYWNHYSGQTNLGGVVAERLARSTRVRKDTGFESRWSRSLRNNCGQVVHTHRAQQVKGPA